MCCAHFIEREERRANNPIRVTTISILNRVAHCDASGFVLFNVYVVSFMLVVLFYPLCVLSGPW